MEDFINIKGKKVGIRKEKFYFYDSPNDLDSRVTVCYLWLENGDVGRGVAIYNPKDVYDVTTGKLWAKTFAVAALRDKTKITRGKEEIDLGLINRKEAVQALIRSDCPFIKKAEKNPVMSWGERKFLFGWKKMMNYIPNTGQGIYHSERPGYHENREGFTGTITIDGKTFPATLRDYWSDRFSLSSGDSYTLRSE